MTVVSERKPAVETRFARAWSEFAENKVAVVALFGVAILIALAVIGPWITPQNPWTAAPIISAPTTRAATWSRPSSTACA
jgi:ABC-type antimicrobial peptide transport system permease subunit